MDLSSLLRPPEGDEPVVPVVRFINGKQLFHDIDATMGSVSPAAFGMLERKREAQGRKSRFSSYDEDSRMLLVTLGTGVHEALACGLYIDEIFMRIVTMKLNREWCTKGATSYYHGGLCSGEEGGSRSIGDGNGRGSSGEGDSSGAPRPERRNKEAYPTIVMEAGCTRPLSIMQTKAKWWFKASNHDIKIVLLAKLYQKQRTIVLEVWEERPRELREGATATRWASEGVPSCQHVVTITETSKNPPVYHVTGELVLSFRLLFLREPQEGEGDIVLSTVELQRYAERILG
ncbi:hypothetical protein ACHAQJ_007067 [Trichoderma viride]